MKYVDRDLKGTFGYIYKQRNFEIIKTVILFAMAFGIFFIGLKTLGTKKSLWTVFAILAMLPACKALVGVIMFMRYKSLNKDKYNIYCNAAGNIQCLFENIITTSKKSYFLPVIAYEDGSLIGFIEAKKSEDIKEVTEHLDMVMKNAGHKGVVIKIFDKEEAFIARLCQMNEKLAGNKKKTGNAVFETLKAVSL